MYSTYFKPFPTLETERLILRKVTKKDAKDLYEYCSDPVSSRYSDWQPHGELADTKQFIKGLLSSFSHGEYFMWCIELKESGKVIGSVSITEMDRHYKVAELGYGILKAYWNQGYATEATVAVLDYLFCTVGVQRVFARIVTENLASVRLALRLNMECDGLLRKGIYLDGVSRDVYVYAITDEDYKKTLETVEEVDESDELSESIETEETEVDDEVLEEATEETEASELEETQAEE